MRPGDDSAAAAEFADAVKRDIVDRPGWERLIYDLMDEVAKGYSVIEAQWKTDEVQWRPERNDLRDPRWFEWDRDTGRQLLLRRTSGTPEALPEHKFVIHMSHTKSGIPARDGVVLPATYYHLIKSYDVASWIAFVDVYGYPLAISMNCRGKTACGQVADDLAGTPGAESQPFRVCWWRSEKTLVLDAAVAAGCRAGSGVPPGLPRRRFEPLSSFVLLSR